MWTSLSHATSSERMRGNFRSVASDSDSPRSFYCPRDGDNSTEARSLLENHGELLEKQSVELKSLQHKLARKETYLKFLISQNSLLEKENDALRESLECQKRKPIEVTRTPFRDQPRSSSDPNIFESSRSPPPGVLALESNLSYLQRKSQADDPIIQDLRSKAAELETSALAHANQVGNLLAIQPEKLPPLVLKKSSNGERGVFGETSGKSQLEVVRTRLEKPLEKAGNSARDVPAKAVTNKIYSVGLKNLVPSMVEYDNRGYKTVQDLGFVAPHVWYVIKVVTDPEICYQCGDIVEASERAVKCQDCTSFCHPECFHEFPVPCVIPPHLYE